MDRKKFLDLVEKQAMGKTTVREDRMIFRMYDQFQKREGLDTNELEDEHIRNRIKTAIDSRIAHSSKLNGRSFSWYFKAAATLALLIGFSVLILMVFQKEASVEMLSRSTNQQQKATVTLADGTKVHLNVDSEIRFPERFGKDNRVVEMEGEAFFEVAEDKDRPFIVNSNGLSTRVLGTSFNMNAHLGKDMVVAVKTGKVEVADLQNTSKNVVLNPNQKATFILDSKELLVEEVDMDYYLDWRNKTIAFNLNTLEEVMDRISRVYNIQIDLKGYKGNTCLIKATYSNNNLYSILYGLQNLVDFEYNWIDEKSLEVNYKGCKN